MDAMGDAPVRSGRVGRQLQDGFPVRSMGGTGDEVLEDDDEDDETLTCSEVSTSALMLAVAVLRPCRLWDGRPS